MTDTGRIFWGIFGLLCAVAAHLSYILFVPSNQLQSQITQVIAESSVNSLSIAQKGSAAEKMAAFPNELVYATCPFDLAQGRLIVSASVPDTYWSIEVYNNRGGSIYTLNDSQAPRKQLNLFLYDIDPDARAIVDTASSNDNRNTITVLTGSTTGMVIIRSGAANAVEQKRSIEALNASSCRIAELS